MAEQSVNRFEEERGQRWTLTITDQLVPKHEHHPLSFELELFLNYNMWIGIDVGQKKETHVYLHFLFPKDWVRMT